MGAENRVRPDFEENPMTFAAGRFDSLAEAHWFANVFSPVVRRQWIFDFLAGDRGEKWNERSAFAQIP